MEIAECSSLCGMFYTQHTLFHAERSTGSIFKIANFITVNVEIRPRSQNLIFQMDWTRL